MTRWRLLFAMLGIALARCPHSADVCLAADETTPHRGVLGRRAGTPLADRGLAADEALLRRADIPRDDARLLAFLAQRDPDRLDVPRIEALIAQLARRKFRERRNAVDELIRVGVLARPFLVKVQQHKDLEVRRLVAECLAVLDKMASREVEAAAIRLLRNSRPAGTCAVLLRMLPSVHDAELEVEIHVTLFEVGMKAGEAEEALLKGLNDPKSARRGAAALVVGCAGGRPQRDLVWKLLRTDRKVRVRLRAANGLIASGDVKAVPTLLPMLTEAPLDVAEEAWSLLVAVAGKERPLSLLGDRMPGSDEPPLEQAVSRARCRAEWESWWKDHETTLVLTRAELTVSWLTPDRQAKHAAGRFVEAMAARDTRTVERMAEFPHFAFSNVADRREFEALVESRVAKVSMAQFGETRLCDFEGFFAMTSGAPRAFFEQRPAGEMRVVYGRLREEGRRAGPPYVVFVQVRPGKVRVVGFYHAIEGR